MMALKKYPNGKKEQLIKSVDDEPLDLEEDEEEMMQESDENHQSPDEGKQSDISEQIAKMNQENES